MCMYGVHLVYANLCVPEHEPPCMCVKAIRECPDPSLSLPCSFEAGSLNKPGAGLAPSKTQPSF